MDKPPTPLIQNTAARILSAAGQAGNGETLPSEKALSEIAKVSRTTVRKALELLESEGRIRRKGRTRIWCPTPRGAPARKPTSSEQSLDEVARRHIIRLLASGSIKPGEPLHELSIARELKISTVPVREALRGLEGMGLLQRRARRSWVTAKLTRRQIRELMEVRRLVEGFCLNSLRGASESTLRVFAELRSTTASLIQSADFNLEKGLRADRAFHEGLLQNSGNRYLTEHNRFIYLLIEYQFNHSSMPVEVLKKGLNQHLDIIDSILQANWRQAKRKLDRHLDAAERWLLSFF